MTLPYPEPDGTATAGWSGSEASHDRARDEAAAGISAKRQRIILDLLATQRARGATWREISAQMWWHHGQASGALSVLHKAGRIVRLAKAHNRERCSVYVLPEYVEGRLVSPYVDRAAKRAALIEQVRKEAYDLGWEEGYARGQQMARDWP